MQIHFLLYQLMLIACHCEKGKLMHISYSLPQIRLGLFISIRTSVSASCHHCSLLTDGPPAPSSLNLFHYLFTTPLSPIPISKGVEKLQAVLPQLALSLPVHPMVTSRYERRT